MKEDRRKGAYKRSREEGGGKKEGRVKGIERRGREKKEID